MKVGDRVKNKSGNVGTVTYVQKNGIVYVHFDDRKSATRLAPGKVTPAGPVAKELTAK